jgi:hypothetical protein
MRTLRLIVAAAAVLLVATIACKKDKIVPSLASITVVNAMAESNSIVPKLGSDTAGSYYNGPSSNSTMVKVNYGASRLYSPVAGVTPLLIVPFTDTTFKIFNGSLTLNSGDIFSLFFSGDTAHADTMLVRDNIPYYADSSVGVRFVNLAQGGKALTINLTTDTTQTEFPVLSYKGITDFKKYNASSIVGKNYKFQVRDQASNTILMTYTWTFTMYKNVTLVIAGSTDPASTTPLKVFSVNNF